MKLYHLDEMGALLVDPVTRAPRFAVVEDDGETQEMPEPPALEPRQAALPAEGEWTIVPDHRGEFWRNGEGERIRIAEFGDPADLGLTPIDLGERGPVPPADLGEE